MEEKYIPIGNPQKQYENSLARFMSCNKISENNKRLVQKYIRDAALGKTVIGKSKKKIGPARLNSYIIHLTTIIYFVNKDLDTLTQEDMELFIEALETNKIKSRQRYFGKSSRSMEETCLSNRYKAEIKVSIRKFYKWLWGKSKVYPEIVEWIDTFMEAKEVSALTESEVKMIIARCRTTDQRALIQVLFDGGFRIGELLNVRLQHVKLKSFHSNGTVRKCFVVRVPFSKTLKRTVALPMHETTKWMRLWLEDHPAKPTILHDGTLDADDMGTQLFPVNVNAMRLMIKRTGRKVLGKRVYPHLLRHSSATYWCNKLPWFKLCKRFGWTMTSSMPQRYIDREGVDELEVVRLYHEDMKERRTNEI